MSRLTVSAGAVLRGCVTVPGDKSISHRALLLGSLAEGSSHITGFLPSADCRATLNCLRALGVRIQTHNATTLTVHGRGPGGLEAPTAPLDCVRSGTTMRLLTGVLAGQPFTSTLGGDHQLLRRPMGRVVEPLRRMGANIEDTAGHAPLTMYGQPLHGIAHELTVASAQVKSAILLSGLTAEGSTSVHQPGPARDHTERMLAAMGADIQTSGLTVTLHPVSSLAPLSPTIPGDVSSAAFLLVAAALVPDSDVTVTGVGINPTRTGLLDVLRAMGTDISVSNQHSACGETLGDVTTRTSDLRGVTIEGDTVVRMIDEFPVLAVAATQAHGTTVVRDANELRVKETDRIAAVVQELRRLGAQIEAREDGFVVEGPTPLHGEMVHSHGDHRLAMALAVAGLVANGDVIIQDMHCVEDSFPGFVERMQAIGARV